MLVRVAKVKETNTTGQMKQHKLSYIDRKVAHWNRMGTPSGICEKTGAAQPNWVKEQIETREKKEQRR